MSESVLRRMIHMEEKHMLFDMKCKDFIPWGYLRGDLYMRLSKDLKEVSGVQSTEVFADKIRKFKTFLHQRKKHRRISPSSILFVSHPRRFFIDGSYKCIYTDDLADLYGEDGFSLENGFVHSEPAYTKRLFYSDYKMISLLLSEMLYLRFGRQMLHSSELESLRAAADKICAAIKDEFCVVYPADEILKSLIFTYLCYKRDILRNTSLLKKFSPRMIVEVVGYTKANMALNESAKKLGIPVAELQHGVIGKGHFGYNYGGRKNFPYFPDMICLWGDYWKESADFPVPEDRLISCGYPYLEQIRKKWGRPTQTGIVITVLSQPIVAEWIAGEMLTFISLLKQNGKEFKIYYKLHPAEYTVKYDFLDNLAQENVEIIRSSEISVYELFAKSTIQIGSFSTAIFEGLNFHLQTYLIDTPKASDYVGDLCEKGYATLIKSGAELYDRICLNPSGQNTAFDSNFFFCENALNNLKAFLDHSLSLH